MNHQHVPKAGIKTTKHPLSFLLALACSIGILLPQSVFSQDAYYHLVAGSFKNFKAASESAKALKAKKYDPLILFPTQGSDHYRVSIYHSLNKQEVDSYAAQLKKAGVNSKSFWVLTQADPATQSVSRSNSKLASPTSSPSTANFHLISGTFQQFENANQALTALRVQGFEPYIIFPSGSNSSYRVSVYASSNRKEVESYSNMLRKRGKNPGWIYEQEPGVSTSLKVASSKIGPSVIDASNSSTTYHLIGGSYKDFTQANEFAQQMQSTGFDPLIMFPEPGKGDHFRVSVYRSTNRTEVNTFKNNQASNKALSKSWILAAK